MKAVLFDITGDEPVLAGVILDGCLYCGADIGYERTAPEGVSIPLVCGFCGGETEMKRVTPTKAAVRRPYGCRCFVGVESSNLDAAGSRDGYLLVRFRKGGVYRYADAAELLVQLVEAKSAGRFFHAEVRGHEAERLCATYGCFEPSKPSQPLCQRHFSAPHRS